MKKGTILMLLGFFLALAFTEVAFSAFSFSSVGGFGYMGGRIINTKATEVQILESVGYVCPSFGTTISIVPIGSPAGTPRDYFIPAHITPKTRTVTRAGQLILARYEGYSTVSCVRAEPPDARPVTLPTINLFGTSR